MTASLETDGDGDRSRHGQITLAVLLATLLAVMVFALFQGAFDAATLNALRVLFGLADPASIRASDLLVIEAIRLPRVVNGALIGASLAVSGAMMQGLFRNPLADPGIVGVSAGASLGAVSVIVLGNTVLAPLVALGGMYTLPLAAFLGGLLSTLLLYRIATRQRQTSIATMLLAGIALGAFALAITGLLIFIADDQQLRQLTFWSLGSLAGSTWAKVASAAPIILPALAAGLWLSHGLNAMAFGEASARHMGVPVQRLKNIAIVAVAGATGAAVAVSGGIGFVGIVVPHLLRLVIGPDHRYLLPCSALLGASFLILADTVSRTIVAPAELPIGIVTAAIGAPFFLWILLRRRGIVDL